MVLSIILLFLILRSYISDRITAYIYGGVIFTFLLFLLTELLSVFNGITFFNLWVAWGTIDFVLVLLLIKRREIALRQIKQMKLNKKITSFLLLALFMIILSLKIAPYNWDSMTYHLPRLFHWMQNQSVAHYATHIERQVASPVLAEFVNLHVYVMTKGSDLLLNLLQCVSFLTNGALVYHIAKKLGSGSKWQLLSAVLFYATPIAFAEAHTTQVDNFAAMWMLFFVYLILDFVKKDVKLIFDRDSAVKVCILAACVGFGYLTKPSICIGMVVFIMWLLFVAVKRKDKINIVAKLALCATIILLIVVLPEIYRNFLSFNAISAPSVGAKQIIGSANPRYILLNFFKNFTFNLPNIWFYKSSHFTYKFVIFVASLLRVELNHPAISEGGMEFLVHEAQTISCDTAVNPVILLTLFFSVILFMINIVKKNSENAGGGYYVAALFSFIIFCAVLRWEPFVSRYMISYFAVLCPALALPIENFVKGRSRGKEAADKIRTVIYFMCITEFMSLGLVYANMASESDRNAGKGYFINRASMYNEYKEVTDYVNKQDCANIGLIIEKGFDYGEYPLLKMLKNNVCIKSVNVNNETSIYEDWEFEPDLIIVMNKNNTKKKIMCHQNSYKIVDQGFTDFYIFEKIE